MRRQFFKNLPFNVFRIDDVFQIPDRTLADRKLRIRDQEILVHPLQNPQTLAFRTCPEGRVKGKEPRFHFRNRKIAVGAGEALAEHVLAIVQGDHDFPVAEFQSRFHGIIDAASCIRPQPDPVDHDFKRVLDVLLQFDFFIQIADFAVNPNS